MNAKMFKKALVCLTLAIPFATSSSYCMNQYNIEDSNNIETSNNIKSSNNIENSNNNNNNNNSTNIYNKDDKLVPVLGKDGLLNFVNNNNNSNNTSVAKSMLLSRRLINDNQSNKNNMGYYGQSSVSTPTNNNPTNNNPNNKYVSSQNKEREKVMAAYGAVGGEHGFSLHPSKKGEMFTVQQAVDLDYIMKKKRPELEVAQQKYDFSERVGGQSNNKQFVPTGSKIIPNINNINNFNNINDTNTGNQSISDEEFVAVLESMQAFIELESKNKITIDSNNGDELLMVDSGKVEEGKFTVSYNDLLEKYSSTNQDTNTIIKELFGVVKHILPEIQKARSVISQLCRLSRSVVSLLDEQSILNVENIVSDKYVINQVANNFGVNDTLNIQGNDPNVYGIYGTIISMIRKQNAGGNDFLSKLCFQAINTLTDTLSKTKNSQGSTEIIKKKVENLKETYDTLKLAYNVYYFLLFLAGGENAEA